MGAFFRVAVFLNSVPTFGSKIQLSSNFIRYICTASILNSRLLDHYFHYFRQSPDYNGKIVLPDSGVQYLLKNLRTQNIKDRLSELDDDKLIEAVLACGHENLIKGLMKTVDGECVKRLKEWRLDQNIKVMDAWLVSLGSVALKTEYFHTVVPLWVNQLKFLSKLNFVQMIYILSQKKSVPLHMVTPLQSKFKQFLKQLTLTELAIVCNSFYKLSIKLGDKDILDYIVHEIQESHNIDTFDLVSLVKFLRQCEHYSSDLVGYLESYILKNIQQLNLTESAHLLATFSNLNIYKKELYTPIEMQFIKCLFDHNHHAGQYNHIRLKDIARYLWAFAHANHVPISQNFQCIILNYFKKNLNSKEFLKKSHHLVDCIQSLICLQIYPKTLIKHVLTPSFIKRIEYMNKNKPVNQLHFISCSARIMTGSSYTNFDQKDFLGTTRNTFKDVEGRNGMMELLNIVNCYSQEHQFVCSYILPHVSIGSIGLKFHNHTLHADIFTDIEQIKSEKQKTVSLCDDLLNDLVRGRTTVSNLNIKTLDSNFTFVSLELLDSCVTLRTGSRLTGMMKIKVLQMVKLGVKVAIIHPDDIFKIVYCSANVKTQWMKTLLRECVETSGVVFRGVKKEILIL